MSINVNTWAIIKSWYYCSNGLRLYFVFYKYTLKTFDYYCKYYCCIFGMKLNLVFYIIKETNVFKRIISLCFQASKRNQWHQLLRGRDRAVNEKCLLVNEIKLVLSSYSCEFVIFRMLSVIFMVTIKKIAIE